MERTDIIFKAYDVADEIKSLKEYKRLIQLNKIINEKEETLILIEEFNKWKQKYEEARKYGKYHPDYKIISSNFIRSKNNLYSDKLISEYKKLENYLQKILNSISRRIGESISKQINVPNDLGIIKSKCGGRNG